MPNQTLNCKTHGETPWNYEVICDDCGRLYRLPPHDEDSSHRDDLLEPDNPPYCDCGALLTPSPEVSEADQKDFTARPICPGCFETHKPRMLSA